MSSTAPAPLRYGAVRVEIGPLAPEARRLAVDRSRTSRSVESVESARRRIKRVRLAGLPRRGGALLVGCQVDVDREFG